MIDNIDILKAKNLILSDKEAKDVLIMTFRVKILEVITKTFQDGVDDTNFRSLVGEALFLAANDWKVMNRIAEKTDDAV